MTSARRALAVVAAVVLVLGGCREPAHRAPLAPALVSVDWRELTLPAPPGGPGRLAVRAATDCGDRSFLVGAVVAPDGSTRPAAWRSADGRSWEPLAVRAASFYGRQNVLYAAGCRDGQVSAIGAQNGGVHGNPRISGWRQAADGGLVEVPAGFELYNGPAAANVSRITGGPAGWLIVGNRVSGAAVWRAADAASFEIVEAAPELSSDGRGRTWAFDGVAVPEGWLVVGGIGHAGRAGRDPLAWVSPDGRSWRRQDVPAADGYDELQRVAVAGRTRVAVGLRGATFGTWRDAGRGWVAAGRFGSTGGAGLASVAELLAVDGQLVAAVSDGTSYGLWVSGDEGASWRELRGPGTPMPAGAQDRVAMSARGGDLLLAVDDGRAVSLWSARVLAGTR